MHLQVDLVPTIQAALETAREPLHPTLPSLIRVYAHAAMTPAPPTASAPATAPRAVVSGLPLQLLKGLFARAPEGGVVRGDKRGVASGGAGSLELGRALGAYYVLCCEDARHLPRAGARQDVPASVSPQLCTRVRRDDASFPIARSNPKQEREAFRWNV